MVERTCWVEKERRKKLPTGAHTPGVPPKVQIRKVIKTRNQSAWSLISTRLPLFTATAITSGAKREKINPGPAVAHSGGTWQVVGEAESCGHAGEGAWKAQPAPCALLRGRTAGASAPPSPIPLTLHPNISSKGEKKNKKATAQVLVYYLRFL